MAAHESVSPDQFGFITHDEPLGHDSFPWPIEREEGWSSKMLDLSTPLHTRQGHIDPALVEKYSSGAKSLDRSPPEVVRHQGNHLVLNGHHRIAAARQRGQSRIKVNIKDINETGETA